MSTFEVTVIECDGGDDCASRFVGRPGMRNCGTGMWCGLTKAEYVALTQSAHRSRLRLWQVLEYAVTTTGTPPLFPGHQTRSESPAAAAAEWAEDRPPPRRR